MNELLQESAYLYALGLMTAAEQTAFKQEMRANAELRNEVHKFQEATLALAKSAPQASPPPGLRVDLLAAFNALPPVATGSMVSPKVVPFSAPDISQQSSPHQQSSLRLLPLIPWAAAAAMAVLFYQNKDVINLARQETAAARVETVTLKEREKHFLEAVNVSETAKAQSDAELAQIRVKLEQTATALSSVDQERETLLAELTVLRRDNRFDKTRIAVLGSLLKNQPQAVAVSLWRQDSQDGLLVVENMPALPPGRDYQLWVIDPNLKTPVSAGVFKVDAAGKVRLEFKPARNVQSAYKFAVTVENEGGAKVPSMDQMVVIGG